MRPDDAHVVSNQVVDFEALLRALDQAGVRFIIAGGVAATIHGSARLTTDLDVIYLRSAENHRRLVEALTPLRPYLRGAPEGLPFTFDERTINAGLNFTLSTIAGPLDLLGEISGGGRYEILENETIRVDVFGLNCLCLSIDALIRSKTAAGRPKDFEVIAELEAIREESDD